MDPQRSLIHSLLAKCFPVTITRSPHARPTRRTAHGPLLVPNGRKGTRMPFRRLQQPLIIEVFTAATPTQASVRRRRSGQLSLAFIRTDAFSADLDDHHFTGLGIRHIIGVGHVVYRVRQYRRRVLRQVPFVFLAYTH